MSCNEEKFDIGKDYDTLVLYKKYLLEESKKYDNYEKFTSETMSYYKFKEKFELANLQKKKFKI